MDTSTPLRQPFAGFQLDLRATPMRLIAGMTLIALALRLTDLGSRSLWLDEAFSAWFSDRSFHYLWNILPTYESHPPFYYSVLRLWRLLAGHGHVAMRSLSVLLGTLTIPAIMAIALEQERQIPTGRPLLRAGVAGFVATCSPMFMVISQEARPYPLLTFAYSLAILSLLRLVRQFKTGGAGSLLSWTWFGASTALTCWSHALGILYGLSLAAALLPTWLAGLDRARLVRGLATSALVVAIYLPCLMMITSRAQDWSTNWLVWEPKMFLPQLLALYTVPVEALSLASVFAALGMALLFMRAIATTWVSKGWNAERLILLLWLGPPLLAGLISALYEPVFLARTLSGTLVPAYLMIAGVVATTSDTRERLFIAGLICITLVPAALAMALRPATERWDLLSGYLSQHVGSRDQVWLYPADSALPLGAVGRPVPGTLRAIPEPFPTLSFKGPIRAGWRAVASLTPNQANNIADDPSIGAVPVVWLVTRQSEIFDPGNDVPAALSRIRRPGLLQQWGYIAVRPYYRR